MAVSESQLASGHRLAGDLRSIRRKKGVDLKEVLDATRLADDVIEALEENGLVNHPAFNKVYLRSLYGAYGDAISVRREDMLQALEEVFSGNYVGSLARKYLGAPPTEEGDGEVDEDQAGDAASEVPDQGSPESQSGDDSGNGDAEADSEASESVDEAPAAPLGAAEGRTIGKSEERRMVRPAEHEARMDDRVWQGIPEKGRVLLPNMSGTALLAIAALAFLALIWFAVSFLLDMRAPESDDVPVADTTRVLDAVRPEPIVLPDSFLVDIIALVEPLDPIRVTVDRDLRRPFWIEHMDTFPFIVVDRIQLEREVENSRVIVDGFRVPESWLAQEGVVELSRDRIQAWLDSLTTAGVVPQRDGAYR